MCVSVRVCAYPQGAAVRGREWRDEVKCVQTQVSDREIGPGKFDLINVKCKIHFFQL